MADTQPVGGLGAFASLPARLRLLGFNPDGSVFDQVGLLDLDSSAILDALKALLGITSGGIQGYATLATLPASPATNTLAWVTADTTAGNNGLYRYTGSAWVKAVDAALIGAITPITISMLGSDVIARLAAATVMIWPDDRVLYALIDSSSAVLIGLTASGALTPSGSPSGGTTTYTVWPDDQSAYAIVDPNGGVLLGTGVSPQSAEPYLPYTLSGASVLRASNGAADFKVASARGVIAGILADPANALLRWVDDGTADGLTPAHERRKFSYSGLAGLPAGTTKLVFLPMYGQSLANGATGFPIITTNAPSSKIVSFNGGPRAVQGTSFYPGDLVLVQDDQILTVQALYERAVSGSATFGETQGGGLAAWLGTGSNLGTHEAALFAISAINNSSISLGQKGSSIYANIIRYAERAAALCAAYGITLEIPCVLMDQGENDYAVSPATDTPRFVQLQSDYETDLKAVLTAYGFTAPTRIPILFWLPSSWTAPVTYGYTTAPAIYARMAKAISDPTKFKLIGPQYYIGSYGSDGIHQNSTGYRHDGEFMGRAVQAIRAGNPTGALYITAAANSGTAITITTNAATQLVLDTTNISTTGLSQYGLRLLDPGGAEIALSGIAVSGTNQITATAASALTPGQTYTIGAADAGTANNNAGPTTGPRSCFRDSSADTGYSAFHLYNFLCHQQFAFTAA